jgi:hypothetical protein
MPQPTCHHVHANGALCKSPPLRDRDYCHFHLDQIGRQLRTARARAQRQPLRLKLPLLEDPFAVQVALMQVADAITHDELDVQRGRLLISVLRLASRNLKTARDWKQEPVFAADSNTETAITEWPSFERENDLPQDFNLSTDPEAAFPVAQENSDAPMGGDTPEGALRARIHQALGEAKESMPLITADTVELMDIYNRDGELAARKFADQMVRNDRRRERRLQRLNYEELARKHNIKLAAKKLVEQQQREARDAAANMQPVNHDAGPIGAPSDGSDHLRKRPVSQPAPQEFQSGSSTG